MKFKFDKVLYFWVERTVHEPSAKLQQRMFKAKGILSSSHFLFPQPCFMTFESNATWNSGFQMSSKSKWCSRLKLGLLTSLDVLAPHFIFRDWTNLYSFLTLCFKLSGWVYLMRNLLKNLLFKTSNALIHFSILYYFPACLLHSLPSRFTGTAGTNLNKR